MNARLQTLTLLTALFAVPAVLAAHHSWPISQAKLVTVKGTVTAFNWTNPHPMISLDVRGGDGQISKWSVGGPAINRMERNGWTKTTLKVGDVMTGVGYQYADGSKVIRLERVVLADGRELLVYASR